MLWKKRGRRVRKYHKHIKGITLLILYMPFLLGSGFFLWMEKDNLLLEPVYYSVTTGTVLVIGLGLVFILNQLGYRNLLVFSKWNNLRIMANFLLENGYYTTKKIKRDKQVKEKIILPKVYLKQSKYGLKVSFILQGNKFQDRFLNLGNTLEIQHDGDFTGKKFTKGFVTYEIAIDQFAGRLNLE